MTRKEKEEAYNRKCRKHLKAVLKRCDKMPLLSNCKNKDIPEIKGCLTRKELEEKVMDELKVKIMEKE